MDWKTKFYLLTLKITGHKRYEYFKLLREVLFKGKTIDFQQKALLKLLIHCEKCVPYYRKIFQEINYIPSKEGFVSGKFAQIPPIDKRTVRANRRDLLSEFFSKKELIKETTGGSTGEPLNIYVSKDAIEWTRAAEWCRHLLGGWKFGDKTALFWGNPRDIKVYKKVRKKVTFWLSNRLILDAFNASEEDMRRWFIKIMSFHPKFFYGYASALAHFAKWCLKNQIKIANIQGVFSTAEVLYPEDRNLIQRAFECPVYDQYGSRETTAVAAECQNNIMHVIPVAYVENEVTGMKSGLLITSLFNYAMPLLRYKIEDVGRIASGSFTCKCGITSQILDLQLARKFSYILLPDGRVLHGLFFYYAMYYLEGIDKYQFRQTKKEEMELLIVKNKGFNHGTEEQLIKFRKNCKEDYGLNLQIRFVRNIPVSPSGKFHFVISDLPKEKYESDTKI